MAVSITAEPVERPEDFDLAEAWDEVVARFPEHAAAVAVAVRVAPHAVGRLRARLGEWARVAPVGEPGRGDGDGWARFRAVFPSVSAAVASLLGFGADVEVLDSPEVRRELARIAREVARLYDGTPACLVGGE